MVRGKVSSLVLAVAACSALCGAVRAQNAIPGKTVQPFEPRAPFPLDAHAPKAEMTISYRQPDAMTEQDRLLEADSESAINEKAGFSDLEFNVGKWTYRQIVCPALPNHLFLGFMRDNGVGDVSLFSASIPRNGEGRVRVIPIRRRGYSFFSPAPINALTISAFNHILNEERATQVPDWTGMATCYAALAGAQPALDLPAAMRESGKYPGATPMVMTVKERGGAVIRFMDVSAPQRPMLWTLDFNARGRLLKANHVPTALMTAKVVQSQQPQSRHVAAAGTRNTQKAAAMAPQGDAVRADAVQSSQSAAVTPQAPQP